MRRIISLGALAIALSLFASSSAIRAEDAPAPAPAPVAKGSVSGKVVDSTGAAVKGATVGIINPADMPAKPAKGANPAAAGDKPARTSPMDKSVVPTVTTADDGTYKLADVPAGKYIVLANLKGTGRGNVKVEVIAGQDTKADDIKLAMGNAGGGKKAPKN